MLSSGACQRPDVRIKALARPARREKDMRVQLHRALSKLGLGSRTQAWEWIRAGEVRVDGRVVTDPLTWIDLDRQRVLRSGQEIPEKELIVLALHKPRGVVTTRQDERGRRTVYDLLPPGLPWLFPVGRLDADSEGLLLLTNDSSLSTLLTDPEHAIPKTYRVTVAGHPDASTLQRLRDGVELSDGRTRPVRVRLVGEEGERSLLDIVLTEGRNRQIRRMAAAVGHKVRRLVRVALGELALGDLPAGACRILDDSERKRLLISSARKGR
jgi:23S rRNA pseudouridine2605 synthase